MSTLILITVAVILFYLIYPRWMNYRRMWKYAIHFPGPEGVPILGTVPAQLRALRNNTFREKRLADCIKYGFIHRYYALGKIMFLVYNPQDLEAILTNIRMITKGEPYENLHDWLGTGLLTSTGAKWQLRRKILTPAFHFSILQDFLAIFNQEADSLVSSLKRHVNQSVNIIKPITEFTLSSIGETSLGVQINEEESWMEYKNAVHEFGELLVEKGFRPWLDTPVVKQLLPITRKTKEIVGTLHRFSTKIIQKRKKEVQDTLSYSTSKRLAFLDLLLRAKYREGVNIDDEGIREEVDTFMFEGHDTTAVSLCYTLITLANEQLIQDEIYQEIVDIMGESKHHPDSADLANFTFMERCIKESLRLYPSVPNIHRKVTEDIKTKDGFVIPKGANVNLAIFELHRMPNLWENPEKFDPDRFLPENVTNRHPFAYIPFSAGARNCIGQKFAIMEIKAALCAILRAFRLEPVTKCKDLKFKIDMVLRPVGELNIKFVPRNPEVHNHQNRRG